MKSRAPAFMILCIQLELLVCEEVGNFGRNCGERNGNEKKIMKNINVFCLMVIEDILIRNIYFY